MYCSILYYNCIADDVIRFSCDFRSTHTRMRPRETTTGSSRNLRKASTATVINNINFRRTHARALTIQTCKLYYVQSDLSRPTDLGFFFTAKDIAKYCSG